MSSWIVLLAACAAGGYFGSHLLAAQNGFDAGRGDAFDYPYDYYLQLVVATDGGLHRVAFNDLGAFRLEHADATLQIADAGQPLHLHTPRRNAALSYQVSRDADGALLVDTHYQDNEWNIHSRYRVYREVLTPLYLRYWNPWLIARAALYFGLPLAAAAWLLGRGLRKREESVLINRGERPYLQHRYRLG